MSNLIEQLGGYEKAKSIVSNAPCKTYTYHNHPYQKGYIRCCGGDGKEYFLVSDIEKFLLEHRRANNIFEVGDFVMYEGELYEIKYIYHSERARITDGFQGRTIYDFPKGIRHATDAEIKAGHRLPQLEVLDDPNTIILGDK